MNYGFNNCGCGMSNYCPTTFSFNPFGCGCGWSNCGCSNSYQGYNNYSTFGNGGSWFAIVLVVFLLLIICGCTKIC